MYATPILYGTVQCDSTSCWCFKFPCLCGFCRHANIMRWVPLPSWLMLSNHETMTAKRRAYTLLPVPSVVIGHYGHWSLRLIDVSITLAVNLSETGQRLRRIGPTWTLDGLLHNLLTGRQLRAKETVCWSWYHLWGWLVFLYILQCLGGEETSRLCIHWVRRHSRCRRCDQRFGRWESCFSAALL